MNTASYKTFKGQTFIVGSVFDEKLLQLHHKLLIASENSTKEKHKISTNDSSLECFVLYDGIH